MYLPSFSFFKSLNFLAWLSLHFLPILYNELAKTFLADLGQSSKRRASSLIWRCGVTPNHPHDGQAAALAL